MLISISFSCPFPFQLAYSNTIADPRGRGIRLLHQCWYSDYRYVHPITSPSHALLSPAFLRFTLLDSASLCFTLLSSPCGLLLLSSPFSASILPYFTSDLPFFSVSCYLILFNSSPLSSYISYNNLLNSSLGLVLYCASCRRQHRNRQME